MSAPQEKERYQIIFNFGSFVYMFFIIGFSAGLTISVIGGVVTIVMQPSLDSIESALYELISEPLGLGVLLAFFGIVGFLPYRWLCKRGWGWPTKGIFIKVQEPPDER